MARKVGTPGSGNVASEVGGLSDIGVIRLAFDSQFCLSTLDIYRWKELGRSSAAVKYHDTRYFILQCCHRPTKYSGYAVLNALLSACPNVEIREGRPGN